METASARSDLMRREKSISEGHNTSPSPVLVLYRLRIFLLLLAGLLCLGSMAELWLIEHTESLVQWLPFALCGMGALAATVVLFRPRRAALNVLRIVMVGVGAGSLFGIYEHVESNLAFALEIRPNAVITDVWLDGLRGAAPLLAPGMLGVAALMALAATYQHPALIDRNEAVEQNQGHPRRL